MSDGNYNRNLLPYRNYQSGLRAGRAQALTQCMQALREAVSESNFDEAQGAALLEAFRSKIER